MASASLIYKFRSRFPEFDSSLDPDVAEALDTSTLWLDPTVWTTLDQYDLALLLWAAHFLTLKNWQLAAVQFGGSGSTDLFIRSIGFGERRVMFGERKLQAVTEKSVGPGEQLLNQTIYGQMFLTLRSWNVIPIAVV